MRFSDHPGTRFTRRAATRSGRRQAALRGERFEPRALLAVSIAGLAQDRDDGGHGGGCGCNFCRSVGVGPSEGEDAEACIEGTVAGYQFCALPPLRIGGPSWDPQVAPPTIEPVTTAPLGQTFSLHSRSSATKVIYLDFDGHTTSDTFWNTDGAFNTPRYDVDGNTSAFSPAELQNIQDIWARVAEDFSPFDVNVTTAEPALEDLR